MTVAVVQVYNCKYGSIFVQARCVSHSYIHVTYESKPQIGNASVARDAAQTELGEHRRPF